MCARLAPLVQKSMVGRAGLEPATVRALGVSDRYIGTFCGRTPKSVLARHYSDYSPEKLKTIYEKANLKVFE
jgi:hypothetical protein